MRTIILSLILTGLSMHHTMAVQAGPGGPSIRACSLLTRTLVTKVTPYVKPALDAVLSVPPIEDTVGASGSACSYGGITLQIDPFTPATLDRQKTAAWVSVPGIGDAAYFRDNRGEYAELYVRAGAHVMTVQMDVPKGRTATELRSNTTALAQALLPQLK